MIHSLKPYPAYKDSGVEWLGEVPVHWEVSRLSSIATVVNGYPFDSEYFVKGEGTPLIRIRDLNAAETEVNYGGDIVEEALIEAGDIIVGMDGLFNVARWRGPTALLNQRMCCLRAKASACAGLIARAVELPLKILGDLAHSTTVKHLSSKQVRNIQLGVPPLAEQTAIVRFLDHADRRIQRYIRAKRKLIALLEEQKQAIIHQAVTGQIDVRTGQPYPAYKPSGVEWLGEVPAHWDQRPAKWYFQEVDHRSETGSEELLSVSHITGVTPRSEKNVTMFRAESNVGHKLCRPGDLIINTMWAWMAALGIARQIGLVSPSYAVYRLHGSARLFGEYTDLLLRTTTYRNEYICRSTGIRSSRLRLYPEDFLRIKLLCPTLDEQHAIVEYASKESAKARRAIELAHDEISLLHEYRTRLIADVVTGKLDVGEAAAALPEVDPLAPEDLLDDTLDTGSESDLDEPNVTVEEAQA